MPKFLRRTSHFLQFADVVKCGQFSRVEIAEMYGVKNASVIYWSEVCRHHGWLS